MTRVLLVLALVMAARRAADGASRDITMSAMHRTTVFQARRNDAHDPAHDIPLALVAGPRALLRGSYTLTSDAHGFALHITGKLTADPTPRKPEYHPIDATLPCVDISP